MLQESECEDIVHIGVTRGYTVRHGAGPLPTNDPAMADRLLPERHAEFGMASDLKEEPPVPSLVEELLLWQAPDRQSTEDEWP